MFLQTRRRIPATQDEAFDRTLENMLRPSRLIFNTRHAEQNDFLRQTVAVKNYPATFETVCILQKLATTKGTTLSIHFEPMNQNEVSRVVNNQLNNKSAILQNNSKSVNKIKATVEGDNIKTVYTDFLQNNEHFYYITILVEVYAPNKDELLNKVNEVKLLLAAYGITKDDLIYEQQQAFLSVFPCGDNLMSHMRRNFPSSTAAALYPCSASDRSDPHGGYLGTTTDNGNIFIDFFQRDTENANGNIVIIGESGQGKSTLMKKIIEFMIATGVAVYLIDPEGEYGELITKLGGTEIDCAAGTFITNPLEIRRIATSGDDEDLTEDEKKSAPQACREVNPFKQHLSWLRDFYKVFRPYATEAEINILIILTQNLYYKFEIYEDTEPTEKKSDEYPTIGDLYEYIVEVYKNFDEYSDKYFMIQRESLQNILLFLKDAYDGSEAHLFNGHTNIINSSIINFNINSLLQGARSRTDAVMFNLSTWIWSKVTRRQRRICFGNDELYLVMNRNNLTMAEYYRNFAKRARKYDAIIATATQNLGDFLDPLIINMSSVLFNNPNYKFTFYPGDLDFPAVKKLLKLTDGEIDLISDQNKAIVYSKLEVINITCMSNNSNMKRLCLVKEAEDNRKRFRFFINTEQEVIDITLTYLILISVGIFTFILFLTTTADG
jgi:type IV secretory pathway VirB4 component